MKNQEFDKKRLMYLSLLFLTILLFLAALLTRQVLFDIPVILLGGYLYKYASPVLLKDYNERKKKRLADAKVVQEALKKSRAENMKLKEKSK